MKSGKGEVRNGKRMKAITIMVSLAMLFSGLMTVNATAGNVWWNSSWNYSKELTFDNSDQSENLTNFPVMVRLTTSNFDYSKCNADGSDIRFVDGLTELSYEFDLWNNTGESILWVNVPQIDGESYTDSIDLYYGNENAVSGEDKEGTWHEDYTIVYHMGEANLTHNDSTANELDGTPSGFNGSETTDGIVGLADEFDGVDDWINITGTDLFPPMQNCTQSFWFKWKGTFTQWIIVMGCGDSGWGNTSIAINQDDGWALCVRKNITGTSTYNGHYGDSLYAEGEWTNIVCRHDYLNNNFSMFVNGEHIKSVESYGLGSNVGHTLKLGAFGNPTDDYFNGTLDEVRRSNNVQSDDWIKAEYLSITDNFITFGNENQAPFSWLPSLVPLGFAVILMIVIVNYFNESMGMKKKGGR